MRVESPCTDRAVHERRYLSARSKHQQRVFDCFVGHQGHHSVARAQAIVGSRYVNIVFLHDGRDQALGGQPQVGKHMLGRRRVLQHFDFEYADPAAGQRCARNYGAAVQEAQHLFGDNFARADRQIDAQFFEHVGVVRTTNDSQYSSTPERPGFDTADNVVFI